MKTRRVLLNLAAGALICCLCTSAAHAIYQKTITLSGTVTLVFVAPKETEPSAEDYLTMVREALAGSISIHEEVRELEKNAHSMVQGKGSFKDALHSLEKILKGQACDEQINDPVFMERYNGALSQLTAWEMEASAFLDAIRQTEKDIKDRTKVVKEDVAAAEDAYGQYSQASGCGVDPQPFFDALKTRALSAQAGYNQNVEDKATVDAEIESLQQKLAEAWELVAALESYTPAEGDVLMALLPSPSPFPTPTLDPAILESPAPTDLPAPSAAPDTQTTTVPSPEPTPAPEATPTPEATPATEPKTEPNPEPTVKQEPEPTAKPEPEPTAKPESEPTAKPEPEPTTKPEPEPTPKSEPEPTAKPEPEPTPKPEPALTPKAEPKSEPDPEPDPTSAPEAKSEPEPEPEPEPKSVPEPDPTPKPKAEPEPEPEPEPAAAIEAEESS